MATPNLQAYPVALSTTATAPIPDAQAAPVAAASDALAGLGWAREERAAGPVRVGDASEWCERAKTRRPRGRRILFGTRSYREERRRPMAAQTSLLWTPKNWIMALRSKIRGCWYTLSLEGDGRKACD
jgi:hypothetical protein